MKGELIGINGRGSFDKRGRDQFRRRLRDLDQPDQELPGPSAGRARHRSRHARGDVVTHRDATSGIGRMVVTSILDDSDAGPPRPGRRRRDGVVRRPAHDQRQSFQERARHLSPRAGACRWSIARRHEERRSWSGSWACSAKVIERRLGAQPKKSARQNGRAERPGESGRQVLRAQGRLRQLLLQRQVKRAASWPASRSTATSAAWRANWNIDGERRLLKAGRGARLRNGNQGCRRSAKAPSPRSLLKIGEFPMRPRSVRR